MRWIKTFAGVGFVLCLAAGLFWLASNFSPSPPAPVLLPSGNYAPRFRIASDTTTITEPVDADGYPDYEEAINRRLSKGIDPSKNRIVALLEASGPNALHKEAFPPRFFSALGVPAPAEKGNYLITLEDFLALDLTLDAEERGNIVNAMNECCAIRSWKKEDHPQIAAWIERNRKPLEIAILASAKPQYFHPVINPGKEKGTGGIGEAKSICHHLPREVSLLLCCQAMSEIGRNDGVKAKETFLDCFRFINSFRPVFTLDLLMLISAERRLHAVLPVLLEEAGLSASQLQSLASEIERKGLLPNLADIVSDCERLMLLDEVMSLNQSGGKNPTLGIGLKILEEKGNNENRFFKRTVNLNGIDYNDILTTVNDWYDRYVADLRIADPQRRREAIMRTSELLKEKSQKVMDQLEKEAQSWLPGSYSTRAVTTLVGLDYSILGLYTLPMMQKGFDRLEEDRRLSLIALALAQFKLKTGNYPENLAALVPGYLKAVQPDIFTGRDPIYGRTADGGFLLYSLGPDQIDSGGRTREQDDHSDDIVIKIPRPVLTN